MGIISDRLGSGEREITDGDENMVDVGVDFTDEEFLRIAKLAHEEDITFNQFVRNVLQTAMDAEKEQDNGTSND
jgi:hypothetical protein